jgi:hypothetical protein
VAQAGVDPVPSTPTLAIEALEKDLKKVLKGKTLEEVGWERPDPLTLLLPMVGVREDGTEDCYLLRLHFAYYPEWPPSALFVNPETRSYQYPQDEKYLPEIVGNEIKMHANYNNKQQLICCSTTLEFYLVRHGVKPEHVWDKSHQNFWATISAIKRGLKFPIYRGPMKP